MIGRYLPPGNDVTDTLTAQLHITRLRIVGAVAVFTNLHVHNAALTSTGQ
jgi:hypothetical protein